MEGKMRRLHNAVVEVIRRLSFLPPLLFILVMVCLLAAMNCPIWQAHQAQQIGDASAAGLSALAMAVFLYIFVISHRIGKL